MPWEASTLLSIPPFTDGGLVNVIIDTPLGSCRKYKFDKGSGLFKLSRVLPDGLHFPCNFGFIPGTIGEDGDALDMAVLGGMSDPVGCLVTVRLLGLLKARQHEAAKSIRNDRYLGVVVTPVNEPLHKNLRDVPRAELEALESFFVVYNQLQGRKFIPERRVGAKAARLALRRGVQ